MAAPELLIELKKVSFSSTSPTSTTATTDDDDLNHYSMLAAIGRSGRTIDRFSPHLRDTLRVNIKSLNQEKPTQPPPLSMKKANGKLPLIISSAHDQLISPASSSRYLLSESSSSSSEVDLRLVSEAPRFGSESTFVWPEIEMELPSSVQSVVKVEHFLNDHSSSFTMPQNQQVVVLKVSLHCKGCEGKVRKHISKMEGVTSFTIDLENKKVTVVGDVTPLGVLNSISKVRNAQLWR